jgi:single-strand DNA-binding protein
MNKVILIGNLTKQAELKFTPGTGIAVATFTLAINEGWGDKKKTTFINCVAWRKTAEALASYTDKGSKIAVVGKIQVRDYEKDGIKRYVTEVVADEVEFLDKKGTHTPATQDNTFDDMTDVTDDMEDVPF